MLCKALLTTSVVLLAGCALLKPQPLPEPVVVTKVIRLDCGKPPELEPVELEYYEWRVLGPDEQKVYALTAEDYAKLSRNDTAIWTGVRQLRRVITYYEGCINVVDKDPGLDQGNRAAN